MPRVRFTRHLVRYFPDLAPDARLLVSGATVADIVAAVDARVPGLRGYLVDDAGALRKHVNIFVDGELVRDRTTLSDAVTEGSELDVLQALSGG